LTHKNPGPTIANGCPLEQVQEQNHQGELLAHPVSSKNNH